MNRSIWDLCHHDSTIPDNFPLRHCRIGNCLVRRHSNWWRWSVVRWPSKRSYLRLLDRCQTPRNAHGQDLCGEENERSFFYGELDFCVDAEERKQWIDDLILCGAAHDDGNEDHNGFPYDHRDRSIECLSWKYTTDGLWIVQLVPSSSILSHKKCIKSASLTEIIHVFLQPIVVFLRWNAGQMHAMKTAILSGLVPVRLVWKWKKKINTIREEIWGAMTTI